MEYVSGEGEQLFCEPCDASVGSCSVQAFVVEAYHNHICPGSLLPCSYGPAMDIPQSVTKNFPQKVCLFISNKTLSVRDG